MGREIPAARAWGVCGRQEGWCSARELWLCKMKTLGVCSKQYNTVTLLTIHCTVNSKSRTSHAAQLLTVCVWYACVCGMCVCCMVCVHVWYACVCGVHVVCVAWCVVCGCGVCVIYVVCVVMCVPVLCCVMCMCV